MIKHILSDGTEVPDVNGFVVSGEDHAVLYEVISNITQKEGDSYVKKVKALSAPD